MITHGQCIIMHDHGVHALSLIIMHDYVVFFMLFSILSNLAQHTGTSGGPGNMLVTSQVGMICMELQFQRLGLRVLHILLS